MVMEIRSTALALPDEDSFRRDIQAINRFQQVVHANMVEGQDYGVIPGTTKPTLLKPGAEKIAKLLGLADYYEIIDRQEDWTKPFFRYLIKCSLVSVQTGITISEGLGECNSMESKYRWRWVSERDLPDGIDKTKLVSQVRNSQTGGRWTVYRFENEDIYSQVNTILKMGKKRALVDAALSAGRLSQVFTQDIEDTGVVAPELVEETNKEHWCSVHNIAFFKKGKMKNWAHKIEGTDDWCNEDEIPVASKQPTKLAGETSPSEPKAKPIEADINNIQSLYNYIASHGKEFTRSWFLKNFSYTEEELKDPEHVKAAYAEVKEIQAWED